MTLADKIYRPLYFINNLYFVRCINFLLHYLMQKVLVCPSLFAHFLTKVLPRTSRGSGLLGPHSLLSEPAHFQVELLYNQCPQIIFFDSGLFIMDTTGKLWEESLDDYINRSLFPFQKPLLPCLKMLQASTTGYLSGSLFSPADKLSTILTYTCICQLVPLKEFFKLYDNLHQANVGGFGSLTK